MNDTIDVRGDVSPAQLEDTIDGAAVTWPRTAS